MVEGDGLENRYTLTGIEGSNPSLSAIEKQRTSFEVLFFIFLTAVARENTESVSLEFANTPICIIFITISSNSRFGIQSGT